MVGFPNNHGVFLLKMIILGCEMGVAPFKETPTWPNFMYLNFAQTKTGGWNPNYWNKSLLQVGVSS